MAPKLRPGKGARATILTRYIKPKQPLEKGDKKQRSEVILHERYFDEQNKPVYKFTYALAVGTARSPELHAKAHWVKVVKEGHHQELFDGPGEPLPKGKQTEPKTKWRHSRARAILYDDIEKRIVQFDEEGEPLDSLEEIYAMHPEYSEYLFVNFERRLRALREIFEALISRADEDIEALENYMANHEVAEVTWKGMIQWQGSEAQEYVLQDVEDEVHKRIGYKAMYEKRSEYFKYFDYKTFKQKVRQEIRTKKYYQTLEVRNMQGMKAT